MLNVAFVVIIALSRQIHGFDCSIESIYIDIQPRQVEGSDALSYGSFITIGSPAQKLSLWPLLEHNETALAGVDFCSSISGPACSDNTHGIFHPDQSTTWRENPQYQSLDNASSLTESDSTTLQTGADTLHLYQHYIESDTPDVTNVSSFPTTILSNYTSNLNAFFGPAGTLGLGVSSTLLQHLYSAGKIASRSFGLYLGTGYERAGGAVNGSIVLGGYDAARFVDPIHSFTMSPNQPGRGPLKVHVAQISIVNASKPVVTSNVNLINDTGFDAYITTSQYPLILPQSITRALADILSATPSNNSDNSLAIPSGFAGDITIRLSGGLSLSFPSEWVANPSNISPFSASPLETENDGPFILGAAFLSYAYLAADYDASPPTFYLAPAAPDAPFIQTSPLCPGIAPTSLPTVEISPFVKNGLVGIIIGGTIGGVALGILSFALLRSYLRQRKRMKVIHFVHLTKGAAATEDLELADVKRGFHHDDGPAVHKPKKLSLNFAKQGQKRGSVLKPDRKDVTTATVNRLSPPLAGMEAHQWPLEKLQR